MTADPPPELATNEEWRGIMVRARKDRGMTQAELGMRVGTSQNIISLIETGGVASSAFVQPICKLLKIPLPMHFADEDDASWSQLGHLLRTKNMKAFKRALALVEAMVEDMEDVRPADSEPPKPANRK